MEKKICNRCLEPKPLSDFYDASDGHRDGKRSSCKKCVNEQALTWHRTNPEKSREKTKKWRANHPEQARQSNASRDQSNLRNWHLKEKYGITTDDYERMLQEQNGRCAICGTDKPHGKWFFVDHNHGSGKVRGLLCRDCNSGIGFMREDASVLQKAISYLTKG